MSTCCKYSYNCGPPECVRERIRSGMASRHAFVTNGCCSSNRSPLLHSYLIPYLNTCSISDNKCDTKCHVFNNNEKENKESSSRGKRTPTFWLRCKLMTNNKYDSLGPHKSSIIEKLGSKRDYLNSKLNSLDSHMAKIKEKIMNLQLPNKINTL